MSNWRDDPTERDWEAETDRTIDSRITRIREVIDINGALDGAAGRSIEGPSRRKSHKAIREKLSALRSEVIARLGQAASLTDEQRRKWSGTIGGMDIWRQRTAGKLEELLGEMQAALDSVSFIKLDSPPTTDSPERIYFPSSFQKEKKSQVKSIIDALRNLKEYHSQIKSWLPD